MPFVEKQAAELFTSELALRSWIHMQDHCRKTLQRSDVGLAIRTTEAFDFLVDLVPSEDQPGGVAVDSDVGGGPVPPGVVAGTSHPGQDPGAFMSPDQAAAMTQMAAAAYDKATNPGNM